MTTATLEVLACIAFKQPISQAEIDLLFDAYKRGLVVKLRISSLWRNLPVPTAACALRQLKHFYSASGSQVCRN